MKITDIKIYKMKEEKTNLKAFVSVTFDDAFVVTGLKIFDGKKGLFVAMPSRQNIDGEYIDLAFPITKEFREELIEKVLKVYKKEEK